MNQDFREAGDYTRLGQYEEALASYDKAIAVHPEYSNTHYNRQVLKKWF